MQLAILEALFKQDKTIALRLAGRVQGLNNGLTNQKGMLEGLVKGGSLAKKQAQEKELEAWIAADPARQKKYGVVLPAMRALQAESEKTRERSAAMMTLATASSYLSAAQSLYRLSLERPKPDIEREAGFRSHVADCCTEAQFVRKRQHSIVLRHRRSEEPSYAALPCFGEEG